MTNTFEITEKREERREKRKQKRKEKREKRKEKREKRKEKREKRKERNEKREMKREKIRNQKFDSKFQQSISNTTKCRLCVPTQNNKCSVCSVKLGIFLRVESIRWYQ